MPPPVTPTPFLGCGPALMTPCDADSRVDLDGLVSTAAGLIDAGMTSVIYCGSMGDWPLLSDQQRRDGVTALAAAGLPVIVGTGAQNTAAAVEHARHAASVGAAGLMMIPRVLSRGSSIAAQRVHFEAILAAAPSLPSVIYNSPHYGYETRADLFRQLRAAHPNLVGSKEFGGAASLAYAAEHITAGDAGLCLLVGVDTQVLHGVVNCGATGAITGVGNAMPGPVLRLLALSQRAATGDAASLRLARELSEAMHALALFDEGPDLVLYYKRLMTLAGHAGYEHHINPADRLSPTQQAHVDRLWHQFQSWWASWPGREDAA